MGRDLGATELREMVRTAIAYGKTRSIPLAPSIMTIPAENYFDPARFELEIDRIFRRMPLMLAPTAEIPSPGDYKTLEVAGLPVLIARGQDGVARAMINACTHRGANVATEPRGNAKRFVCPYHGWAFDQSGGLRGVAAPEEFGDIDRACYSLKSLPTVERSGLIWVVPNPKSTIDIDAFLSGYDSLLDRFGFKNWHFFDSRRIKGPNWKVAYDGYLDYYHIPVLHRETFGPDMLNQAIYSAFGPHQRVQFPLREYSEIEATPEEAWSEDTLMSGVWTIFPHISIASFDGGGRSVMISQLLPGDAVGESWTTQMYLMEKPPVGPQVDAAHEQFAFLRRVVEDEDYTAGTGLQKALRSGGLDKVTFGRNESGAQRFHGWVDKIIQTPDEDLNSLFTG